MKFKTTLFLLVLVIAGALYINLVDSKKPSTEELKRVEKRVFRKFQPEKITGIILKIAERENETGKVTKIDELNVQRTPTGWNVEKPVNFPADSSKIRRILDLVKKIDESRILVGDDYKNLDRKGAGIDDPDIIATFQTPATSMTFRIGALEPVGWDNYVEVEGRKSVYLVPNHFKEALMLKLNNDTDDVRRKNVFDARKYLINSIVMEQPDYTVELRRADDLLWKIIRPVNDIADNDIIDKLLDQVEELQINTFVNIPGKFGKRKLLLTVIQGAVSQSLQVGDDTDDNKSSYARRSAYQQLVTINNDNLEPFMRKPDDYRSKLLIVKNIFQDPVHLSLKVDDKTTEFNLKDKAWYLPGNKSPLIDESKVEDYVMMWLNINIKNFAEAKAAKAALSKIWINLVIKFEGLDQPLELQLSKPVDGIVYAERTPGIYVGIDIKTVENMLFENEFRFMADSVIDVPEKNVHEIHITDNGVEYKLISSSNQWTAIVSNSVRNIQTDIVEDIDEALPVNVNEYIANTISQNKITPASCALAPPVQKFSFINGKQKSILIGKQNKYGNYYAMLVGEPYIFTIKKESYDKLQQLLDHIR